MLYVREARNILQYFPSNNIWTIWAMYGGAILNDDLYISLASRKYTCEYIFPQRKLLTYLNFIILLVACDRTKI